MVTLGIVSAAERPRVALETGEGSSPQVRAAGVQRADIPRRDGIQVGTIDALLAQLCRRHELIMLTTDRDFELMARHVDLRFWTP